MSIDTKRLLAQSEVRLFGWVVGQVASEMFGVAEGQGGGQLQENAGQGYIPDRAAETPGSGQAQENARQPDAPQAPKGQGSADPEQSTEKQFAIGLAKVKASLPDQEKEDTVVRGPQLATVQDVNLWLANVQAFSCDGRYVPFRAPALFLVHWSGDDVYVGAGHVDPSRLGLAHLDREMVFASDLKFWTYDRSFPIVRLDMSAGTLQRVVIDLETGSAHGRRIDLVGQEGSFTARLGGGNH